MRTDQYASTDCKNPEGFLRIPPPLLDGIEFVYPQNCVNEEIDEGKVRDYF